MLEKLLLIIVRAFFLWFFDLKLAYLSYDCIGTFQNLISY